MIKPSIRIRGINESVSALNRIKDVDVINIRIGVEECAKALYAETQRLVPVEFGPLKASGQVIVEGTGLNAVMVVQYGGETAPYAWIVHQDITKKHKPPTQDHYMTDAFLNLNRKFEEILGRQMSAPYVQQGLSANIEDPTPGQTRIA